MCRVYLALILLGSLTSSAVGVIIVRLDDEFDDRATIRAVSDNPAVKQFRGELEAFEARLLSLKEKHILALFGQPQQQKPKTFAMPVAGPRAIGLPGIRSADEKQNKDHVEFHHVGNNAGLTIYYHTDGVTPCLILVHFRTDNSFPRLTKDNLKDRLAWDRARLEQLKREVERKRASVLVWEIDPEEEKKQYQEEFARDRRELFDAWLAAGKKLGLRHESRPGPHAHHYWYRRNGTLEREAYSNGPSDLPHMFIRYDKDGHTTVRDEWGAGPTIHSWRWMWPGTTNNIRYEVCWNNKDGRPDKWGWYDRKGKLVRYEWSDSGDGVPRRFTTRAGEREGKMCQRRNPGRSILT